MAIQYDNTPVIGYGEGLIKVTRGERPILTATGNRKFHLDGYEYDVHPYRSDLGGYPVRWREEIRND